MGTKQNKSQLPVTSDSLPAHVTEQPEIQSAKGILPPSDTEAIQVAQRNLARVPKKDWESWHKVHYRYWELLADAGKARSLETATQSYLQNRPEDPFANYYAVHAFLETVEPMRSFTSDMRQDFRQLQNSNIKRI